MRYAVANKVETVRLTREATGGKGDDPRPEFVFDETVKYRDYDPDLPIPMDKLGWMQEQFVKTGNIKQPVDLAKIVDTDVRAKALEIAGKPGN